MKGELIMAHGGHTGGARSHSHVHHYGGGYGRGGGYDSLGVIMLELIFSIGLCIAAAFLVFNITGADEIGGKKPLEGKYEIVQYLHDDSNTFSNQEELVQGLEYLKEKTNIQMIVMTTTEKLSDKKAVEQYYLLVEDEAHVLLIVPPEGSRHPFYYAIGDDADSVINDNAISYLVDQVENSRNGEYWKQELYSFADKLLEQPTFRYDVDSALFIACCMLVCLMIYGILATVFPHYDIGGKKPLEGEYETVQYLHDDDIFSNQEDLIQGLEYLREKTNVQLVIMTTDRKLSYGDAVREYHLTFEDEGHILIIVPQEGSIRFRYAIGADANKVINSEALDYLIKNVRHSRDGEYWKQQLYDFTDELVKND